MVISISKKRIFSTFDVQKRASVCQVLANNHIDYYVKTKYNKRQAKMAALDLRTNGRMVDAIPQFSYEYIISVKRKDFKQACTVIDQVKYLIH